MRLLAVLLAAVAGTACATAGAVPRPFPQPGLPGPTRPEAIPASRRDAVVGTALGLRGVPYRNGGSDPTGFDCSGFVAYVFARHGYVFPRTVSGQFDQGRPIPPDAVMAGDLVFFTTIAPGPSHVGIAISPAEFVHAPSTSGVVRIEALGSTYWASRFLAARRPYASP